MCVCTVCKNWIGKSLEEVTFFAKEVEEGSSRQREQE